MHLLTSCFTTFKVKFLTDAKAIFFKMLKLIAKAQCMHFETGVTYHIYNRQSWSKKEYISYCFGYIHRNPLDLPQVTSRSDWEFSSFRDYAGLRNGTICDFEAGKQLWEENEGSELDLP